MNPTSNAPNTRPPAPPKKSGLPWWAWVLIILGVSVPACGTVTAIAIFGVQKYIANAKTAEARAGLDKLAKGVASCAAEPGADGAPRGLPPSSNAVPRELFGGQKYQSTPAEWEAEPAFACAKFAIADPQYFVYQWKAESAARGVAIAIADLNGDGAADRHFEQAVECGAAPACSVGPLVER